MIEDELLNIINIDSKSKKLKNEIDNSSKTSSMCDACMNIQICKPYSYLYELERMGVSTSVNNCIYHNEFNFKGKQNDKCTI